MAFHRDKHQVARPLAVAVAAGAAHSCVVTASGAVLAWRSMDTSLQVVEVGGLLAGRAAAAVAAGGDQIRTCTALQLYLSVRSALVASNDHENTTKAQNIGAQTWDRPLQGSSAAWRQFQG